MQFIVSGERIATENFSIGKVYTVIFTNGNYFINSCVGIGPDFVMFQQESPKMLFCLDMESAETVSNIDESGGGAGTMNYNELDNKPSINGVPLIGNKTAADLSILPVPIVGENDNNKILTASYSGGVGSYSWQPAPSSGTTDYTQLTNKPQINSVELNGNKSLEDLGIASAEALAGKQDVISDLNTIRSGAAAGATAVQPATLAGYQTLIDSSHKLSSDLVDDTGQTNKFATAAQLAQIETNKNNISTVADSGGAKNLLNIPDNSGTQVIDIYNNDSKPLPAGTYILYCGNVTSSDTDATTCQVIFYDDYTTPVVVGSSSTFPRGNGVYQEFTLSDSASYIRFYASTSLSSSSGDTVSISNVMICTKSQWNISQKYEPYAMTNAELTAAIQALQAQLANQ